MISTIEKHLSKHELKNKGISVPSLIFTSWLIIPKANIIIMPEIKKVSQKCPIVHMGKLPYKLNTKYQGHNDNNNILPK